MKIMTTIAFTAALGVAALGSTSALAAIACNAEGECWHVHGGADFHPEFGVVIHPDDWRWHEGERFRWHEHEGHGYWHGGHWVRY